MPIRFLRGHYDLFRVMPTSLATGSPPREEEEQRWISSATLLSSQPTDGANGSPRTPEPRKSSRVSLSPLNPNFVTPVAAGRGSPIRNLRSSLSPVPVPSSSNSSPLGSSPLMPLQFLRRADDHPQPHLAIPAVAVRPSTPLNAPVAKPAPITVPPNPPVRTNSNPPAQPSKAPRWRP